MNPPSPFPFDQMFRTAIAVLLLASATMIQATETFSLVGNWRIALDPIGAGENEELVQPSKTVR